MKLQFIESPLSNSSTYTYPYQVYAKAETEAAAELYSKGFIHSRIEENHYYLARSCRINLAQFTLSSENRRILRKTEGLTLSIVDSKDFQYDFTIGKQGLDFYRQKFNEKVISAQKWKWIFTSGVFNKILIYKFDGKIVGYCPALSSEKMLHYAYPFQTGMAELPNLGIGMMTLAIEQAVTQEYEKLYLGTVYTKSSLYKTQFAGFEWFNGQKWVQDVDELKLLIN